MQTSSESSTESTVNSPVVQVTHMPSQGTITRKLLVPFGVVGFSLLIVGSLFIYEQRVKAVENEAHLLADAVRRQVAADRYYYTDNVVKIALKANIPVSADYHDFTNGTIPLPATFVREVAERLNDKASEIQYRLALKSLFPINPNQGPGNEVDRHFMTLNYKEAKLKDGVNVENGIKYYSLYVPDVCPLFMS